jgi:hypothetical protein
MKQMRLQLWIKIGKENHFYRINNHHKLVMKKERRVSIFN